MRTASKSKKYADDLRSENCLSTTTDSLGRTIYWEGFKRVSRKRWRKDAGLFEFVDANGKRIPPEKLWDYAAAATELASKTSPAPEGHILVPVLNTRLVE